MDKAEKIRRLLICMAIAYVLLIVMGDSDLGRQLRKRIEVLRKFDSLVHKLFLTPTIFIGTPSFVAPQFPGCLGARLRAWVVF